MPLIQLSETEIGQLLVSIEVVQTYALGNDAPTIRATLERLATKLTEAVEDQS